MTSTSTQGDSEELIGKWFARTGNRSKIFLATKFGITPNYSVRGDPEFVKQEVATSLKRLQTDYIDLYYQHRPDSKVPIEVTVGAMAELVRWVYLLSHRCEVLISEGREGKVKYLGLSESSPEGIRRAHRVHPIAAIQAEYSLWEVTVEKKGDLLDTARELGIAYVTSHIYSLFTHNDVLFHVK